MQDILNALPEAATQVSAMITSLFSSGIGLIVVPFLLVEGIILVYQVLKGKDG